MHIFSLQLWRLLNKDPKTALAKFKNNKITYNLLKFIVFIRLTFEEYFQNHSLTRASALSFALLLTIIPLMATLSYTLAGFVKVHPKQVEEITTLFLPFAPPSVLDYISMFFNNAQKLRGIGIAFLIFLAIGLFGTIEESLNTIWKAQKHRSMFNRVITFTMVVVYGPLFFFMSFNIQSSNAFSIFQKYFFLSDILPFLLVILGFSTLIWLMPNTKVKKRAALLGGLVAATLFEFERWGFGTYIRLSIQTRTIYGAYGILPFFLASLFFVSLFILFGAQLAYVFQNFQALISVGKRWNRRVSDFKIYYSLRLMIDIVNSYVNNTPPESIESMVKKHKLMKSQVWSIIKPIIEAGYLYHVAEKDILLPAHDVSKMKVDDFINSIEENSRKIPNVADEPTKEYLTTLIKDIKNSTNPSLANLSFKELVENIQTNN